MAKKTIYNCAYLRVDLVHPKSWINAGFCMTRDRWLDTANDMKRLIERHCDVESVTIEADTEDVCEFCGYNWTEGDSLHNGGCCEKDAEVLAAVDAMS